MHMQNPLSAHACRHPMAILPLQAWLKVPQKQTRLARLIRAFLPVWFLQILLGDTYVLPSTLYFFYLFSAIQ